MVTPFLSVIEEKVSGTESAYGDVGLRHPEEPFPTYAAIREELLYLAVIQQAQM